MYRLLFSNWKFALVWACMVCLSTAYFFARGGEDRLSASAERSSEGDGEVITAVPVASPEDYDDGGWGAQSSS